MIHTKNSFAAYLTKFASETKPLSSPHMCKLCSVPKEILSLMTIINLTKYGINQNPYTQSCLWGIVLVGSFEEGELHYIWDTVSSSKSYKRTWKKLLCFVCCARFQWQVHLSSYWCIPSMVWKLRQYSSINWRLTEIVCFVDWTTIRFFSFLWKTLKNSL